MIDTKALRSKVLDFAIQGKLTEQIESDGTAEELFAQIQEEKQKLIKEGKIKKEKALPPIKDDEIPFDIPSNWKWIRLKEVCTKIIDGDHNPPKGLQQKTDYLMLSAQNIQNNTITCFEKVRYLSKETFEDENKRTNLKNGDVLLTIVGTIGRSCIFNKEGNYCFQRSVSVISTLIYNSFLKYSLDCSFIQSYMNNNATGAAQLGFYLNKLERLCIPLPPLAEQKRIVERVEEIFKYLDIIDEAQKKYSADAEILKSKLITMGIQGKLTEQLDSDGTAEELYQQIQEEKQKLIKEGKIKKEKALQPVADEEIPFEIPKNWKWVRLSEISYKIWAGRDKPDDFVSVKDDIRAVPVVANGVTNEGILGYTSEATAPENTITVAGRGTIGFAVYRQYEYCPIVRLIVIEQSKLIYPKFLQYFLRILPESSVGSSTPQLTVPMIKPKPIPLPPLAEQKRIADTLDEVLRVIG